MKLEKQISMISVGMQEVSVFRGIQEVSARRLRKELINHNLYLFT